jgi:hypothetical protein
MSTMGVPDVIFPYQVNHVARAAPIEEGANILAGDGLLRK